MSDKKLLGEIELNRIYQRDCIEGMRMIPDGSVDLIIADPPYNIGKDKWDKWQTIDDYIEWMGKVIAEFQRVLKPNGSIYIFHNDMPQIARLMEWIRNNSSIKFKQLIVWNKKFPGASNEGFLQGFNEVEGLRNYQKMAEYCLFYTFQDETGLTAVKLDVNNFSTLRTYFRDFQHALGMTKKAIIDAVGQRADHCFRWNSSQWDMPTPETYDALLALPWDAAFIPREYESLREEYESLRYTFNNQKTHHSVWNYEIAPKQGHMTPKPVELIETILRHSSNENDVVLVPFCGSGSECVAATKLGRNFVSFELESKYVEIANIRLESVLAEMETEAAV